MLKHPNGPHTPSPLPLPSTPKPWGDLGFSNYQRSLTIWRPLALAMYPPFVFEGVMPGDHWPLDAGLGKVKRGCDSVEMCRSPCNRAGRERLLCSSCNCVAERLPLYVSPGQLRGGGAGAGWKRLLVLYQRCYISVMGGWGGKGITGAIEVETPPSPPGQQMFLFCSKSF